VRLDSISTIGEARAEDPELAEPVDSDSVEELFGITVTTLPLVTCCCWGTDLAESGCEAG
jgi:hypothetical protein